MLSNGYMYSTMYTQEVLEVLQQKRFAKYSMCIVYKYMYYVHWPKLLFLSMDRLFAHLFCGLLLFSWVLSGRTVMW